MCRIHPTAIIDARAHIAADVHIGPYTIVAEDVQIGPGCRIGSHVTLDKHLKLGQRVEVHNYACLGTASQDLKHKGQVSHAEIEDDVIIREFVTVNRGTQEHGVTRVGRGAVLMAYSHVAHECWIGPGVVLVNAATLGGEVRIGQGAIISGLVGVHQFCRVGEYTIVGACSKVTQDLPPYILADGHPARPYGPNVVGLRRAGFTEAQILEIRRIYGQLFDRGQSLKENLAIIEQRFPGHRLADNVLRFCREEGRGLARPRPRRAGQSHAAEWDLSVMPFGDCEGF